MRLGSTLKLDCTSAMMLATLSGSKCRVPSAWMGTTVKNCSAAWLCTLSVLPPKYSETVEGRCNQSALRTQRQSLAM